MKAKKHRSDILEKIRKRTSLKSRLRVINQMNLIDFLTEMGFREDKMWTEEEDPVLSKLCKLAEKYTKHQLKEIKEWEKDGRPK